MTLNLRDHAHSWNTFNIFKLSEQLGPFVCGERGGGVILAVGLCILDRHRLFDTLHIDRETTSAFFSALHCLYMRRGQGCLHHSHHSLVRLSVYSL